MTSQKAKHVNDFLRKIQAANKEATKKEAFKDLLNRVFANDEDTRSIVDAISSGAEAAIINIPRKGGRHRGSADTLYNMVIIEFENDLRKTLPHAKEQLAGYLLGQFNSGVGYNYTLIASDFVNWKVFAPDISSLDKLETINEEELVLDEIKSAAFTLNDQNSEDFYYWIDRFLFKEQKQKATLKLIEESFGYQSPIFIQCFREMAKVFNLVKDKGAIQVAFEQWKRFLSIAYGSLVPSDQNFLIHTYLSVFSKMLAYTVVSNDDYIDDGQMAEIIEGSIFDSFNIRNFVEHDFFRWVLNENSFPLLKKSFRLITQELSAFDFQEVNEDILKGVYQEMIDLDTRHALGEYYTPDWLCERVVQQYDLNIKDRVLDPACGSGSFLRTFVDHIRKLHPKVTVEQLAETIYGIDVHPLSVQIAKTTILLALGRDVVKAKKPIHLNVVLANTILTPQGIRDLFGSQFSMQIDKENYPLDTQIFADVHLFDEALSVCEELADQTQNQNEVDLAAFTNTLKKQSQQSEIEYNAILSFYRIYQGFKRVKEDGRDSIWNFIVQNLYKPYFLAAKFDYVIGNPPWFTFGSIRNPEYQNTLNMIATKYNVRPANAKNFPNLEIGTIFLAYCSDYFLNRNGRIAFVLPRSVLSADHHDNTRNGKAKGVRLTEVWDLSEVSKLFNIPSCVVFGEHSDEADLPPYDHLKGRVFTGYLANANCNLNTARPALSERETQWFYVKQGNSSAFSEVERSETTKANPYKKLFRKGADIIPRGFYFVDLNQEEPPDFENRIVNVKSAAESRSKAQPPWTDIVLKGRIESRFLFRTALARSILPFALLDPSLIVLPLTVEEDGIRRRSLRTYSVEELRKEGFLNAARWFRSAEEIWAQRRTSRNSNSTAIEYLNWRNKLTDQDIDAPFLVLYNSSAQDANATVVKRQDIGLNFIVDHVTYVFTTKRLNEAYYLTAILNSSIPNALMKDFQARGSFGARHVHKKILDVYFPRFEESDETHLNISHLSEVAHKKANLFLETNRPSADLTPGRLGRLRNQLKLELQLELRRIDDQLTFVL